MIKYMVMRQLTTIDLVINGLDASVSMELLPGMTGAVPLFDLEEDAIAASGDAGQYLVVPVDIPDTMLVQADIT